jgi:drug/metabolite transporter (DMT)-like permease
MNLNTFSITAAVMATLMGCSLEYSRNVKPLLAIDHLHSMTVVMSASLLVTLFSVVYLAAFGPGLRPAYRSLTWRTALGVVFFDLGTDSLNALALILPLSLTAHSIIGESQIIFSLVFGYCLQSTRFKASDIIGAALCCAGMLFYAYDEARRAGQTTDVGESEARVGRMLLGVVLVLASKAAKELSVYFESKAVRTEGTPEEGVMLLTHMLGAPLALGFLAWVGTDPWSITSVDRQGALLGQVGLTSAC